jgi:hypothetical protein
MLWVRRQGVVAKELEDELHLRTVERGKVLIAWN